MMLMEPLVELINQAKVGVFVIEMPIAVLFFL